MVVVNTAAFCELVVVVGNVVVVCTVVVVVATIVVVVTGAARIRASIISSTRSISKISR